LPGLSLHFEEIPREKYPAFWVVLAAGKEGGTAPAVANAADEVLVQAFLEGKIPFPAIAQGLSFVLSQHKNGPAEDLEAIWEADRWARKMALMFVAKHPRGG
jgi:1-deoxy-D-xylulose-5-phosphate reductoisomerase